METKTMTREELRLEIAKLQGWVDPIFQHDILFGTNTVTFETVPLADVTIHIFAAMGLLSEVRSEGAEWTLSFSTDKIERPFDCRIFPDLSRHELYHAAIAHGRTEAEAICIAFYRYKTGVRVEVSDAS